MFCFQCEETAKGKNCTGCAGACGKKEDTAVLQDRLTGALIGLARATEGNEHKITPETDLLVMKSLFATLTNVNFDNVSLSGLIDQVHKEKERLVPECSGCGAPCGRNDDYEMEDLWKAPEDIRSLKSLLLLAIRGIGAYAYHAAVLGYRQDKVNRFLYKALFSLGTDWKEEKLLSLVMEAGEVNLSCMELLDQANTETFGIPAPREVSRKVEKGPFIVISGHDLRDLQLLLEQTRDKGISIYTHGEMLPAHGYPEFKKYPHLKGHFGTAWQNQQKEFDSLPAALVFTTNCLKPPRGTYADRLFTTGPVSFPGTVHIGEEKDFTPVIEKALELGGYPEDRIFPGINGGEKVTTGFSRGAVLPLAEKIVAAVKKGEIRHFFLVGGCDGSRPGRNYYTEFVKRTPEDTVVLTLGCGKFRFNDLDLGTVAGIPRLLDMGQCNDAFGAIKVASALADAFDCGLNDLPLSMVLSWYEQKAVSILLSLLHLGVKNILLGPSLPAFLSPKVLNLLVEKYQIAPVTTPEEDLKRLLS